MPEVEVSTVTKLFGTWVLAVRSCGCSIVVPGAEFKFLSPPHVGMTIRHRHIVVDNKIHASAVEILAPAA